MCMVCVCVNVCVHAFSFARMLAHTCARVHACAHLVVSQKPLLQVVVVCGSWANNMHLIRFVSLVG